MAKITDIDITSLLFQEGSVPSTPASTKWRAYFKTTGMFVVDDVGTETGPLGAAGVPTFVGARAYNSTTQSVNSASLTAITLDSEDFDTNSIHDTGSNTSRLTASHTGYWLVRGSTTIAAGGSSAQKSIMLSKTGTLVRGSSVNVENNTALRLVTVAVVSLTASTDYMEMKVYQATGSARNVGSTTSEEMSVLEMYRIGT